MTSLAVRLAALSVLALVALAGFVADIVPTLDAGLSGAASLCAPHERAPATPATGGGRPRLRDAATLHMPRCGVA